MRLSVNETRATKRSPNRIYSNAEATQVLASPEDPQKVKFLERLLAEMVESSPEKKGTFNGSSFETEFRSGERRYLCRAIRIPARPKDPDQRPSIALVMEHLPRATHDATELASQFGLTRRERETIEYLMQGLTSKEIALRMNISSNTVKAFLRLIMFKMGVSTRSGIIGKLLEFRSY